MPTPSPRPAASIAVLLASCTCLLAAAPERPVPAVPSPSPATASLAASPAPLLLPRIAGATSFRIRASVLGFGSSRRVSVEARLGRALDGRLDVRFDRPLVGRMGIRRVDFHVRILDAATGALVDTLDASVEEGATGFRLPFRLPRAGTYRFEIRNDDLEAGFARIRILPDVIATMRVEARPSAGPVPAVLRGAGAVAPAPPPGDGEETAPAPEPLAPTCCSGPAADR